MLGNTPNKKPYLWLPVRIIEGINFITNDQRMILTQDEKRICHCEHYDFVKYFLYTFYIHRMYRTMLFDIPGIIPGYSTGYLEKFIGNIV